MKTHADYSTDCKFKEKTKQEVLYDTLHITMTTVTMQKIKNKIKPTHRFKEEKEVQR